jgi:hypothetical protein
MLPVSLLGRIRLTSCSRRWFTGLPDQTPAPAPATMSSAHPSTVVVDAFAAFERRRQVRDERPEAPASASSQSNSPAVFVAGIPTQCAPPDAAAADGSSVSWALPQHRQEPREPTDGECCGSGCERCVWTVYWEEQQSWQVAQQRTPQTTAATASDTVRTDIPSVDNVGSSTHAAGAGSTLVNEHNTA